MAKKFIQRGRHLVLSLVSNVVVEVTFRVDRLPTIVFRSEDETESLLEFEDDVVLIQGSNERVLKRPRDNFDPQNWNALLELIGKQVSDALAHEDGCLRIEFTYGLVLTVTPSTGCEAWHFQRPRPGRAVASDPNVDTHLSLYGDHGHLILPEKRNPYSFFARRFSTAQTYALFLAQLPRGPFPKKFTADLNWPHAPPTIRGR